MQTLSMSCTDCILLSCYCTLLQVVLRVDFHNDFTHEMCTQTLQVGFRSPDKIHVVSFLQAAPMSGDQSRDDVLMPCRYCKIEIVSDELGAHEADCYLTFQQQVRAYMHECIFQVVPCFYFEIHGT